MLKLYSVFHCNLAFSLIPREHFKTVIERCYRPLLKLAEAGFPIGIEMTAWTLKEVKAIDSGFVTKLRELWNSGKCEFIGSGYSQAIFPLIPAEVNRWNLEIGNRYYKELLGRRPALALVNEQTYSRGLADLYREAGYEAIIMDWSNSFRHNRYPKEYQYYPQRAAGIKSNIDLLWSNSIAFQKFQRCIHNEIPAEEYLDYLFSHDSEAKKAFMLYTNDAEVFDYRPGNDVNVKGEYKRMAEILESIKKDGRAELDTPSGALASFRGDPSAFNIIRLESTETPVVCKKQEKYNPVRWAVAGRDSAHINAECYKVFKNIRELEERSYLAPEMLDEFKESLCDLWGSDFRTNTVDEKFSYFHNRLGWLKTETERLLEREKVKRLAAAGAFRNDLFSFEHQTDIFDESIKRKGDKAEISARNNTLKISTGTVEAEFLTNKGFALKTLKFPAISENPLIGTLPHGFYEDIGLGADFFSGHLIHISKDGKKTTDLKDAAHEIAEDDSVVVLKLESNIDIGTLWKVFRISKTSSELSITYRLKVKGLHASSLRAGIFTFMPEGFDRDTLFFETVNGGVAPERFYLKGHTLTHDEPVSQSVSASGCIGSTEGWVRFGDKDKSVRIFTDKSKLYSVPMIKFSEPQGEDKFFLRLYHSLGEVDDTAWWVWRGYNEVTFDIKAEKNQEKAIYGNIRQKL